MLERVDGLPSQDEERVEYPPKRLLLRKLYWN
jgi:hypothetical protein